MTGKFIKEAQSGQKSPVLNFDLMDDETGKTISRQNSIDIKDQKETMNNSSIYNNFVSYEIRTQNAPYKLLKNNLHINTS